MWRVAAIVALAAILAGNLVVVVVMLDRPMHYDENEYMHSSWLIAAGKTIYRDFYEDHPPHFFLLLRSVLPGEVLHVDVRVWTMRARLLMGLCGTALVVLLGVFAWRISGEPVAAVVAAAVMLSSAQMWARALNDVRAEAPTLMLFWAGVVLLTWSGQLGRSQAIRAGSGIGLMFIAELTNPKWPLEGLVMGAVFLHYLWRAWRDERRIVIWAIAPAVLLAIVAVAPMLTVTTFADYVHYVFVLKMRVASEFTSQAWVQETFRRHPLWATTDAHLRWWWFGAAAVIVTCALASRRWTPPRVRLAWIAIALHAAALVEMRFLLPYPYLWAQYLVMIAATAAIVYALLPFALAALAERLRPWIVGAALIVAVIGTFVPLRSIIAAGLRHPKAWDVYWERIADLQSRLRPGDTVWISPPRHPVAAFDASYYGYSFAEGVPVLANADELPLCRLASGAKTNIRFIELGPWIPHLEGSCQCGSAAYERGALQPTDWFAIFEVRSASTTPPSPRARAWLAYTQKVWPNLCAYDHFFAGEGVFDRIEARVNRR